MIHYLKSIYLHFIYLCLSSILIVTPIEGYSDNKPFLVHDSGNTGGMFAEFASVLGGLDLYERGSFSGIEVNFNTGHYLDLDYGSNWWNYYFDSISIGDVHASRVNCTLDLYLQLAHVGFALSRQRAFELIERYIHVRPEIAEEVDAFVKAQFQKYFVIGIHFRGTDKILEYPRMSYKQAYEGLKKVIGGFPKSQLDYVRVYVASDEQLFVEYLKERIPNLLIYNNFVRSNDTKTPLHYDNNFYSSQYQCGREALVDVLLLSRCQVLLRPNTSCFSWAATLFNPNLNVIIYN